MTEGWVNESNPRYHTLMVMWTVLQGQDMNYWSVLAQEQMSISYPRWRLIMRGKFLTIWEKQILEFLWRKAWDKISQFCDGTWQADERDVAGSASSDPSFYSCTPTKCLLQVSESETWDFLHCEGCLLFQMQHQVLSGSALLGTENQGFRLALGHPTESHPCEEVTCYRSCKRPVENPYNVVTPGVPVRIKFSKWVMSKFN